MGYRKKGLRKLSFDRFDKGYFHKKDFEDVPKGGSSNCKHVFNEDSSLRPFPGIDLINSIKASFVHGSGSHFMKTATVSKRLFTFGTKLFEESSGTLTDITGTATIGNGQQVQFVNWERSGTELVIGCDGTNTPFKFSGTGSAENLLNTPGNFDTIDVYHDTLFGAVDDKLHSSDTGEPESYDNDVGLFFQSKINRVIRNGSRLAVLMNGKCGSVQGFDYLDFIQEDEEIANVGCVGRNAACKAFWKDAEPVIATISEDGVYLIDRAFNTQKLLGDRWFKEFNQSNISKSVISYSDIDRLLYVVLPFGASVEPDYLIICDLESGAVWPGPNIHENFITSMSSMKDDNNNEFIYFTDKNGFCYKFNRETSTYHTGTDTKTIDHQWTSRKVDLDDVHSYRKMSAMCDQIGDFNIQISLNFGLKKNFGSTGTADLGNSEDTLGNTFILGASTLGGSDYVFSNVSGVSGFGRWVEITIGKLNGDSADTLSETFKLGESRLLAQSSFRVKKVELLLKRRRMASNAT